MSNEIRADGGSLWFIDRRYRHDRDGTERDEKVLFDDDARLEAQLARRLVQKFVQPQQLTHQLRRPPKAENSLLRATLAAQG